jgi:catechol 2,3-dioxygenase-like lactoylglutathione lyase family enzyme
MLKFDAVGLFVTDMDTMVAFYRDVLGMETDWKGAPNAELSSGSMRLIMYSRDDFETMTSRAYAYPSGTNGTLELAFSLLAFKDVDREYTRVVAAGAVPVFPPTDEPWGQRTSYVADPDGNLIEISSFNLG